MVSSFLRAIGQLPEPRIMQIILQVIAATVAVILIVVGLSYMGLSYLASMEEARTFIPFVVIPEWVFESLTIAVLVLLFMFYPAISTIIAGLFLDKVADAVEEKHYPKLGDIQNISLLTVILMTFRLLAVTIVLNLLALPLYFIPIVNMVVFYGLNGYLIGREYYELIAQRRLPASDIRSFRKQKMKGYFIFGVVATFLMTVPFVNLLMPVIATAAMVHLFQKSVADR